MTRTARMVVLGVGVVVVGLAMAWAFLAMPQFGASSHPYRDHAVAAAFRHDTANVVSSVNFDQRAIDTFGEESILLAAVVGVAVLLRPAEEERRKRPSRRGRVLDATRLLVYVLLPLTLVLGLDVVAHGAITPGGGFQGGVVLATGLHLLYLGGRYQALERLRPLPWFEAGEAIGVAAFAVLGATGLLVGATFLANVLPTGSFAQLASSGLVPLLNAAVGMAVASSVVVLLAKFLEQALVIETVREHRERKKPKGAA